MVVSFCIEFRYDTYSGATTDFRYMSKSRAWRGQLHSRGHTPFSCASQVKLQKTEALVVSRDKEIQSKDEQIAVSTTGCRKVQACRECKVKAESDG